MAYLLSAIYDTRHDSLYGVIQRTAPFSYLLYNAKGTEELFLPNGILYTHIQMVRGKSIATQSINFSIMIMTA